MCASTRLFRHCHGLTMTLAAKCVRSLLCFTVICTAQSVRADSVSSQEAQVSSEGFVIANGRFLPAPYYLVTRQDGQLEINGNTYNVTLATQVSTKDQPTEPRVHGSRRRPRHWARHRPRPKATVQEASPSQTIEELAGHLRMGGFVIVNEEEKNVEAWPRTKIYELVDVLLGDDEIGEQHVPASLRPHVDSLRQDPDLQARALSFQSSVEQTEDQNYQSAARVHLLDRAAYPLSTLGMLMVVVATGHLLSIRPPQSHELSQTSVQSGQATLKFLAMILAFSVLDLVWTVLASHDGSMRELNPIGSRLIEQPVLLVAFKMLTTGVSAGILFSLRTSKRVQLAAWWICLVLTLLTARWLVFNSLLV